MKSEAAYRTDGTLEKWSLNITIICTVVQLHIKY